jgi:hypothetical protein
MTSTTRAALERLIETWRVEAERGRFPTSVGVPRLDYTERAYAHVECADELSALLTAEGPSPAEDAEDAADAQALEDAIANGTLSDLTPFHTAQPSREALAARLTDDVVARALIVGAKWDTGKVRTVLLDALCPQQEPT